MHLEPDDGLPAACPTPWPLAAPIPGRGRAHGAPRFDHRGHPEHQRLAEGRGEDLHADRQPVVAGAERHADRRMARPGWTGSVQTSDRYIASGSSTFAPSSKAVVGVVAPSRTSTLS